MAKYTPLAAFLRRQTGAEVDLSFRDIERIVGGILPKAASLEDWWRANPAREQMPQHLAFADAGFVADPRTRAETVRFIRIAGGRAPGSEARLSATETES